MSQATTAEEPLKSRFSRQAFPYLLTLPSTLLFGAVVLIPIIMTIALSFYDWGREKGIEPAFLLKNWKDILQDDYIFEIFFRTFRIAVLTTIMSTIIGAPEAYILHRMRSPWKGFFLLIAIGPLLISVIARTLGWALLFGGSTGIANKFLLDAKLISFPIPFMFTETGTVIALTHVLAPFMVLSVWASLQRLDPQLENAAAGLGAPTWKIFSRILIPQIMPGILAGGIIVFALAASAFATPAIIGGRRLKVVATLAYDQFIYTLNWPLGAAIVTLLLISLTIIIVVSNKLIEKYFNEAFQ